METMKTSEISRQLQGLALSMKERLQRAVEVKGLSPAQAQTLFLLEERPGLSLGETAAALLVRQSTASVTVDSLVKKKLLKRDRNPDDRREMSLSLTVAGRQMAEELRPWSAFLERAIDTLPPDAQDALWLALGQLSEVVKAQTKQEAKPVEAVAESQAA